MQYSWFQQLLNPLCFNLLYIIVMVFTYKKWNVQMFCQGEKNRNKNNCL